MKRILLFILAAVAAIGFSAFTPAKSKFITTYYESSPGVVQIYTGPLCPETDPACNIRIGTKKFRLFFDANLTIPVPGPDPF